VTSTESIRELAESVLAPAGLELWDVEVTRDVVRILVDRPAAPPTAASEPPGPDARGIDLDALSAASRALSPVLDAHPEVGPDDRYQLEVSSPGIERTLRTPDHFRRYLDTEITVKTGAPVAGARRHRGRLIGVAADCIALEPEGAAGTRLELRYDQIDRARTILVWGPTTGRGTGRGRAPAALNPKDPAP
jgi:ribosome maturation factor RimP